MIQITCAQARDLRAVLKKSVFAHQTKGNTHPVLIQAGADGLRIRANILDVAVEYHQPGAREPDSLVLPGCALDDLQDRSDSIITLEGKGNSVQARWDARGIPQVKDYDCVVSAKLPPFPEAPERFVVQKDGFLRALSDAVQSAAEEPGRYATTNLQLRGASGDVIATDSRQLLVQRGFEFPWQENMLIPPLGVYGCRELALFDDAGIIGIGKTDNHISLRVGPWTIHSQIDKAGRFPDVENVIPKVSDEATCCHIVPDDVQFLAKILPRLPGNADENGAITLDVNGQVYVRARAEGQKQTTDVLLSQSTCSGKPLRCCLDRHILARALHLEISDLFILDAERPLVWRNAERTFLAMPMANTLALKPTDDPLLVKSPDNRAARTNSSPIERKPTTMTEVPHSNGVNGNGTTNGTAQANGNGAMQRKGKRTRADKAGGIVALIDEAQAVKEATRTLYERAAGLIASLKRHRKQSRLAKNALVALRQLQQVES